MALTRSHQTSTTADITSVTQVLSIMLDASNPRLCQIVVKLGDGGNPLDGSGGEFELYLYVGGRLVGGDKQLRDVNAGTTQLVFETFPFVVPAGESISASVKSPNAGDTSVAVVAEAYDVPTGNMIEISGDAAAADNLESYCDGTTVQPVNVTQIEGGDATDQITASVPSAADIDAALTAAHGSGSWVDSGSSSVMPWAVRIFRDGSASQAHLTGYQDANLAVSIEIVDADDQAVDLTGVDLLFIAWQEDSPETPVVQLKNYDGQTDVAVSGTGGNIVTITGGAAQLTEAAGLRWALRNKTDDLVVAEGTLTVREAADET